MKKRILIGLAVLAIAGLVLAQVPGKHFSFTSDRFWANSGVLATDNRIESRGTSNGLRLAYSDGVYTDLVEDEDGLLYAAKALTVGGSSGLMSLAGSAVSTTAGMRAGILSLYMERAAATASTMGSGWDGNPDLGMQIYMQNRSVSGAYGSIRAAHLRTRNRGTTAGLNLMNPLYVSCENYSGSGTVKSVIGAEIVLGNDATVDTELTGLKIQNESTGTTSCERYGIRVVSTLTTGATTFTSGLRFEGYITNAFDFSASDLTNKAANYVADMDDQDVQAHGNIKVRVGSQTLYLYLYTNAAHKN